MGSPASTELLEILRDLTSDINRTIIQKTSALAWMLPDLDAHVENLVRLIGHMSPKDAAELIRLAIASADERHDSGRRFMYYVLLAFESFGSQEERTAVAESRMGLFPNGLAGSQLSYRKEIAEAQTFETRLQEPRVRPGLDLVERAVPAFVTAQQEVFAAVESMRQNLRKLADHEAKATATPYVRELFDARRQAQITLSNFAGVVEYALRGDDQTTIEQRQRLLDGWRKLTAVAALRPDNPEDVVDLSGPSVSEPSPEN